MMDDAFILCFSKSISIWVVPFSCKINKCPLSRWDCPTSFPLSGPFADVLAMMIPSRVPEGNVLTGICFFFPCIVIQHKGNVLDIVSLL